ncbi:MAG: trigger factor [Thermoguttaceae bacterium]
MTALDDGILNSDSSSGNSKLEVTTEVFTVSACERRIKLTVPLPEVERYFAREFDDLERTAYVPGFRVGKSPRKLVERRFRKEVSERVKGALVVDALDIVNNHSDLTPISEPDFDYPSLVLAEGTPFVFEFAIEVRPEFDLPEWRGLKIEKPVRDFTKEDVDKAIDRILATYAALEPSDEPAKPDDYLEVKLSFFSGDELLSPSSEETIRIRPKLSFHDGSIEGFDKLMTGVKAGDIIKTTTKLTDDAANPEYRGKEVEAQFEVLAVKKLVAPTLTDSFLEKLGGYKTEGDFRDAVLDILKRQLDHEQRRRVRRQITELLTVSAQWELPPGLLKKQSERELRRAIMELQRSGFSQEAVQSQLNFILQNSKTETARALKEHFILEKVAEVEKIEETQEDYDVEIALIAAQSGTTPRRVRAQIEKSNEMDILRNQIIERKVIDLICNSAQFTEVSFEMEESDEEAIDRSAVTEPEVIAEVSEADLKAVHQEIDERKRIDPNTRTK